MDNKGFTLIELLAVILIVGVISIICMVIYKEIDFGDKKGIVIDKRYHSAYVTTRGSHVNGSTINIPVTQPATWNIKIKKNNKTLWIEVSENEYNNIKMGDCYNCN